jgi:flagellar hook assembly protein FlgD
MRIWGRLTPLVGLLEGEDVSATHPVLLHNSPNPFRQMTTMRFTLGKDAHVSLRIYSIAGRLVNTLVDCKKPAGLHMVHWDGIDANGNKVPSGVYFYRIEAGEYMATKKMVVVR